MEQRVLSVTQISEYIQAVMDDDSLLRSVAVRGEISNYKVYPSGHHYFTLKDEVASLKCVMFRGNAVRLRFRPDNGMQILAMGKVSVYPRDGAYQLYCTGLIPDGIGDLYAEFERLKTKLAAQGLFDPSHKKMLPKYPETIALITSAAGAAVHDMLRILNKRYPLCTVRLLPVRVQGAEAPDEIAAAIAYANHHKLADLLIVGRGGGSIEDLWAFNDEKVAWAVYQSEIPVISAVGHEPDVTICDLVADLRAATPSNGAELAVPDGEGLRQQLDTAYLSMSTLLQRKLDAAGQRLRILTESPVLSGPQVYFEQRKTRLALLENRLFSAQNQIANSYRQRFVSQTAKLDALSPLKVLSRGYAITKTESGSVVRSVKQVTTAEPIEIVLNDGQLSATVTHVKEHKL